MRCSSEAEPAKAEASACDGSSLRWFKHCPGRLQPQRGHACNDPADSDCIPRWIASNWLSVQRLTSSRSPAPKLASSSLQRLLTCKGLRDTVRFSSQGLQLARATSKTDQIWMPIFMLSPQSLQRVALVSAQACKGSPSLRRLGLEEVRLAKQSRTT